MKYLKLLSLAVISSLVFACSSDDDASGTLETPIDTTNLPTAIQSYINTHFPNAQVIYAEQENENGALIYEIDLSGDISLEFNEAYEIIGIDGDSELPSSTIPLNIYNYVLENYPNNYITDWEIEDNTQEIELNNGLELIFDSEGNFVSVHNGHDDDSMLSEEDIPAAITSFVNQYFPNLSIVEVVLDHDDDGNTYDVELSDNTELEFNEAFEIISIESDTQLPDALFQTGILNYIESNYPNNYITEWELEDNYQEIQLDNGIELYFDLDGNYIGSDNDEEHDDDDDNSDEDENNLNEEEIPTAITDFINEYFPNHAILEATQTNDDGIVGYEIELANNIELEFDEAFNITSMESDTELPNALIPENILNYINTHYPDNYIIGWELDDNEQEVKLNNELELIFDTEGNFVSVED